jgi:hypothetical protein
VRRDVGRGAQPTTDDQLFIKPCVPAASRLPPLSRRCPSWPAVVVPPPTGNRVRRSTSPPCKRVRRGRWRIALLGHRLLPLGARGVVRRDRSRPQAGHLAAVGPVRRGHGGAPRRVRRTRRSRKAPRGRRSP